MTPPRFWLYYVGAFLGQYNPVDLMAIAAMLGAIIWLWYISVSKANTYDFSDNFKSPYTNKAAASVLVYMFLAGLSVWYCVRVAVDGGDPSNFMLTMLGIFVGKGAVDKGIDAWGTRAPPVAPDPASVSPMDAATVPLPVTVDTSTTVSVKKGK